MASFFLSLMLAITAIYHFRKVHSKYTDVAIVDHFATLVAALAHLEITEKCYENQHVANVLKCFVYIFSPHVLLLLRY